jgi:hypothetical protein
MPQLTTQLSQAAKHNLAAFLAAHCHKMSTAAPFFECNASVGFRRGNVIKLSDSLTGLVFKQNTGTLS